MYIDTSVHVYLLFTQRAAGKHTAEKARGHRRNHRYRGLNLLVQRVICLQNLSRVSCQAVRIELWAYFERSLPRSGEPHGARSPLRHNCSTDVQAPRGGEPTVLRHRAREVGCVERCHWCWLEWFAVKQSRSYKWRTAVTGGIYWDDWSSLGSFVALSASGKNDTRLLPPIQRYSEPWFEDTQYAPGALAQYVDMKGCIGKCVNGC